MNSHLQSLSLYGTTEMNNDSAIATQKQTTAQRLESFVKRAEMLVTAYEKQSRLLESTRLELQELQMQNAAMKDELERVNSSHQRKAAQQLTLDVSEGSPSTLLPHSQLSDTPSIDRTDVQLLLSEIESCIALLEA
ncbi:MAG TPA: hypothetical protein DDZ19_07045 [Flavobacteriales bacterium]|jgi:hypothetical protein|nr:hypothetical protein [Flavobacteriales bacterium]